MSSPNIRFIGFAEPKLHLLPESKSLTFEEVSTADCSNLTVPPDRNEAKVEKKILKYYLEFKWLKAEAEGESDLNSQPGG